MVIQRCSLFAREIEVFSLLLAVNGWSIWFPSSFLVFWHSLAGKIKDKPWNWKTLEDELWRSPFGFSSIFIDLIADKILFFKEIEMMLITQLHQQIVVSHFSWLLKSLCVNLISSV